MIEIALGFCAFMVILTIAVRFHVESLKRKRETQNAN